MKTEFEKVHEWGEQHNAEERSKGVLTRYLKDQDQSAQAIVEAA